jgi:hypothetical protein
MPEQAHRANENEGRGHFQGARCGFSPSLDDYQVPGFFCQAPLGKKEFAASRTDAVGITHGPLPMLLLPTIPGLDLSAPGATS